MRSATSFFNPTLYRKDLYRFWPLWVLYTVLWQFMLPLQLLSEKAFSFNYDVARWVLRTPIRTVGNGTGLFLAVCYGGLCAAAVWHYLYNHRSANLMHSLPVRRDTHFITHTLAGMTFFVLPHLITLVTTLAAEAVCGSVAVAPIALAMLYQTLMTFFFFALATACAMLTGHIVALPVFFVIFNFVVVVLTALTDWLGSFFLYGYVGTSADSTVVRWLTPILNMGEEFGMRTYTTQEAGITEYVVNHYEFMGGWILFVYAAVALLLLALALFLYRTRHMETAGDVVAVPALRPVFLYSVGFCGALGGGCLLYSMLGLAGLSFLLIAMLLCGVVAYFAALMLLHKSFRVFRHGWWGCGLTLCLVLALCGALQVDLFGAEARIPDPEDVAMVEVRGFNTYPHDTGNYIRGYDIDDPDTIAAVLAAHQVIINDRHVLREWQAAHQSWDYVYTDDETDLLTRGLATTGSLRVTYTLKNGATLTRNYGDFFLRAKALADPTSLESRLQALANDPVLVASRYGLADLEKGDLLGVALEDAGTKMSVFYGTEDWEKDFHYEPPYYSDYGDVSYEEYRKYAQEFGYVAVPESAWAAGAVEDKLVEQIAQSMQADLISREMTEAQAEAIRQAILSDFAAGNLGVRYLFDGDEDRQNNTYVADLQVTYRNVTRHDNGKGEMSTTASIHDFTITLTPQATATIAVLREMGFFESTGVELRTNGGELHLASTPLVQTEPAPTPDVP